MEAHQGVEFRERGVPALLGADVITGREKMRGIEADAEPFRAIDDWVRNYRKLWESRLDRFDAALARQRSLRQRKGKKK